MFCRYIITTTFLFSAIASTSAFSQESAPESPSLNSSKELAASEVETLDSKALEKPLDLRLPVSIDLHRPLDLRSRSRLYSTDQFATRGEQPASRGVSSESHEELSVLSDSERAKLALAQYDELARKEPFSVKSYALSASIANESSNTAIQTEPRGTRIDFDRSKAPDWSQSNYNPHSLDQRGQQAKLQIERTRQRSFDRVADMIHPGFGRLEFKVGENNVRLDYLNPRRCKLKGAGLCVQIGFK